MVKAVQQCWENVAQTDLPNYLNSKRRQSRVFSFLYSKKGRVHGTQHLKSRCLFFILLSDALSLLSSLAEVLGGYRCPGPPNIHYSLYVTLYVACKLYPKQVWSHS